MQRSKCYAQTQGHAENNQRRVSRACDGREPNLEHAIGKLVEQLHAYEKKYRMRSEVFFKFIVGTPAEDQEDFLDWAMCYRQYFRLLQSQLSAEKAGVDVVA